MLALMVLAAFEAFVAVPAAFAGIAATLQSARRIFELADRTPSILELNAPAIPPIGFDIQLEGVSLVYPGGTRPALACVTLAIREGARLAVMGSSGSGKSSLADLLVRFRDPSAGDISLGGVSIRSLSLDDLRARITLVPQRPHLFTASIADNLRIACPDADNATLLSALADVGLDMLVASLPMGLATQVGVYGTQFSGGEARRIAIARALLTKAPIVILDEPSEGLDTVTEHEILGRLGTRLAGRTLIVLTHSESAIRQMRDVVVLNQGHIAHQN